jgi:hypothetical protein
MIYGIWLKRGRAADPVWFEDSVLPGLIPDRVFDLMVDTVVDEQLGLCKVCDVAGERCHVVEAVTGRKFCPVLFADVVRPRWKVAEVV